MEYVASGGMSLTPLPYSECGRNNSAYIECTTGRETSTQTLKSQFLYSNTNIPTVKFDIEGTYGYRQNIQNKQS